MERSDVFKGEEGWELIRNIIRGYGSRAKASVDFSFHLCLGSVEIPLQLLKDLNEKGDFVDVKRNYPVLEQYGLPKNFDLEELLGYLDGYEGMKDLENMGVERIENVIVKDDKICLDVLVYEPD